MAKRSLAVLPRVYQGRTVEFRSDGWFNATSAAQKHGKVVYRWLTQKGTQDYMRALSEALGFDFRMTQSGYSKTLVDVVRSGKSGADATWLHPKLGVAFARWLSVDFAVWCDLQIDQIIRDFLDPPRSDVLTEKRQAHNPMMRELMEFRAEQGKDTETHHYTTENRLCNWAVFGEFKTRDESTMSNDELTLLGKVREHNTHLIAAGTEYAERKPMLNRFATRMRTRMIEKARGAGLKIQPSDGL